MARQLASVGVRRSCRSIQNADIDALTRLSDQTGQVQAQVSIGVLRESLDNAESNTLALLQSMQPRLGQNVDLRL